MGAGHGLLLPCVPDGRTEACEVSELDRDWQRVDITVWFWHPTLRSFFSFDHAAFFKLFFFKTNFWVCDVLLGFKCFSYLFYFNPTHSSALINSYSFDEFYWSHYGNLYLKTLHGNFIHVKKHTIPLNKFLLEWKGLQP